MNATDVAGNDYVQYEMRAHYLGLSKAAVPFNNGTIAASERHTIASNMEMKMYMHGG
jgi:hypothetical protein